MQQIRILGYNKSSKLSAISNKIDRAQAGHLFWNAFWADAFASIIYKQLPQMTEEEHDVDPMHHWSEDGGQGTSLSQVSACSPG